MSELSAGSAEGKCAPDAGDEKKLKRNVEPPAGQGAAAAVAQQLLERPPGATAATATTAPVRGAAGTSYIFLYLSIYLSMYLSIYLSTCLSVYLSML